MNTAVKPAKLTLVNGTEELIIRPVPANASNPIMCRSWDLGAPDVRYTSTPNPGADGTTESPGFLGSRQVSLELQILGGPKPEDGTVHDAYWYAAKLVQMTHPSANPVLIVERLDDLAGEALAVDPTADTNWYMQLRGNPYAVPYVQRSAAMVEMQLSFTCPSGVLESGVKRFDAGPAVQPGNVVDWVFPCDFPQTFGLYGVIYPQLNINVGGDSAVNPIISIAGPATNPEIICDATDPKKKTTFRFKGLTLAAGQSVGIDMGTGNIRLGPTDSGAIPDDMTAYNTVDWEVSTFWTWTPGMHEVVYNCPTGIITVEFSERRLTI